MPVSPSRTRLVAPVATAATTGRPQAIDSSVTLPNASVIDGLSSTSLLASAAGEVVADLLADEDRLGQALLEPGRAGPSPMTSTWCLTLRSASASMRIGEHVEALFHHQPAEEGDDQLVVLDAEAAPPCHVAAARVELVAVDAARPDRDVAVHPLGAQHRGHRFGRRDDRVAAAIQPAHDRARRRLEHLQMIISEIGLEARVDRGDGGDVVRAGPS